MEIEIPTLCYWEGIRPMNSCMLCVVRDVNTGQLMQSCSTVVTEGLEIETDSGDVCNARKSVLELTLSEHIGDCEAPCSHTCPASMNIPVMMRQIYAGELDEAAYTVTEGLVFPWTLGYVCPAPCENPCRRKSYDETMKIRTLHREVAVKAQTDNPELLEPNAPDTGRSVAVVGAGLTGMSAAWIMRKEGHAVTIYEKDAVAGGRWRDVSEEDLPKHVLDAEVANIGKLGVKYEYNQKVGEQISLEELDARHEAILVACNGCEAKVGGKIFEAKEHKLAVRAVGNGKTTALWVNRYLKSMEPPKNKWSFESKIGKLKRPQMESMHDHNVNKIAMEVNAIEGPLVDSREEAGRCLHCDCRKRVSCDLRIWSSEYGAESKKYKTTEEREVEVVGLTGTVIFEPGKCIRCGLCVEISRKYGEDIGLTFIGRGFDMRVEVPFKKDLEEGITKSADECIAACPTAAIAYRNKEDIQECHTTTWIEV